MIEIPGKIPVAISPFFWVCAGLIGWLNSPSVTGMLIWVGIIFVSVLFHEFGHAIAAVLFRQSARIQLVALGGLTSYEGPKLKFWQQFIIVFNGPLFGFFLFLGATIALQMHVWPPLGFAILKASQVANLFWTVVNLFPVLPLDGGQLLRIVLEGIFGLRGYKVSLLIGAVLATIGALGFFLLQAYLAGAFFFLFAFQSFDLWQKSRSATVQDRDDDLRHLVEEAEKMLQEGRKSDADQLFTEVRTKAKSGLLYQAATQYLAFLYFQAGRKNDAYDLLLSIENTLADESKVLLHELASDRQNWPLVVKLSTECYQLAPSQQIALNNARGFAHLHQPKPAGGWLQTAYGEGPFNLEKVLNEEAFQGIKQDPDFQHFIQMLQ
jgi:Zn-dependent protease